MQKVPLCPLALLLCLFSFLATETFATPNPKVRQKTVFIGSSDPFFYTFLTEFRNPGSYYEDYETTYLTKHSIITSEMVEKHTLQKVSRTKTLPLKGEGVWSRKVEMKDFNVPRYLAEEKVDWIFPGPMPINPNAILFDKKGVRFKATDGQIPIISWDDEVTTKSHLAFYKESNNWTREGKSAPTLKSYLRYSQNAEKFKPKILGCYHGKKHYFFLYDFGQGHASFLDEDDQYRQSILAVPRSLFDKPKVVQKIIESTKNRAQLATATPNARIHEGTRRSAKKPEKP